MQTSRPRVFTAGDCFTGPETLIGAIGGGNRAAIAIDKLLRGAPVRPDDPQLLDKVVHAVGTYRKDEVIGIVRGITRQEFAREEPATRKAHFREVESVLPAEAALAEAQRCLRCYRLAVAQV
jgi:formate dehydrogenase beta subunit